MARKPKIHPKFRALKKGDRVEVEWLDAACTLNWDEKQISTWIEDGGEPARTIGYVAYFDNRCIILPCEIFKDGSKRGITVIPAAMVQRVRRLK
jgi:hypothetical protein